MLLDTIVLKKLSARLDSKIAKNPRVESGQIVLNDDPPFDLGLEIAFLVVVSME